MKILKRLLTFQPEWFDSIIRDLNDVPDNSLFSAFTPIKNIQKIIKNIEERKDPETFDYESQLYVKFDSKFFLVKNEDKKFLKEISAEEILKRKSFFHSVAIDLVKEDLNYFYQKYTRCVIDKNYEDLEKHTFTQDIVDLFSSYGIDVKYVKGACSFMRMATQIDYDGVPYVIRYNSNHYNENKESIIHYINHLEQIKDRHHSIVKDAYDFLKQKEELGDIWVLIGGGSQIEVFYGNKNGYIGILSLDMDTLEEREIYKHRKNEKFILLANFKHNNEYFKGFKHDKIRFVKA